MVKLGKAFEVIKHFLFTNLKGRTLGSLHRSQVALCERCGSDSFGESDFELDDATLCMSCLAYALIGSSHQVAYSPRSVTWLLLAQIVNESLPRDVWWRGPSPFYIFPRKVRIHAGWLAIGFSHQALHQCNWSAP